MRNIEDSTYQQLNIYVPLDTKGRNDMDIPILMRNDVGGYMASPAGSTSAVDATGRALAEGYQITGRVDSQRFTRFCYYRYIR